MLLRVVIACVLVFSFGCKKEPTAPSSEATPTAAPGSGLASDAANNEAVSAPAPSQTDLNATLSQLTQAVRRYAAEKQRVPQNIEEVAVAGYVNGLPAAPTGKHFAINKKLEVYLASH